MKHALVAFIAIFVISVFLVHCIANSIGSGAGPLVANVDKPGKGDKLKFRKAEAIFSKSLMEFNEEYFNVIAGNSQFPSRLLSLVPREALKSAGMLNFKSKAATELMEKTSEYYINAMTAKAEIASENLKDAKFVSNFDAIEYYYSGAEAMLRIMGHFVNEDYGGKFIPDEVTARVFRGDSWEIGSESEDYEKTFRWYVVYSSLKASFDVNYLQIIFGRNFYSKKERIDLLYRMKDILEAMDSYLPPEPFKGAALQDYKMAAYSYLKKMEFAEYYALSFFPNSKFVNAMTKNVYSFGNLSKAVATKVGNESFRTLGLVVIFELYSKIN